MIQSAKEWLKAADERVRRMLGKRNLACRTDGKPCMAGCDFLCKRRAPT